MRLTFSNKTNSNPTQQSPHGPNDHSRTINYHHLDISGHDGMDEQDIGWRNGWWLVLMRTLMGSRANAADFS
jgi:hypothetical protein